ncbi:MAG: hypothetical protein HYX69_12675 [Planctomycetia bacterium]|nr:hypothetical protein [Planctomycetia bacterium]
MKTSFTLVALLIWAAGSVSPAAAQYGSGFYAMPETYSSATLYESGLRGEAAFIDSIGRFLESDALAARENLTTQEQYVAGRQMRIAVNREARQAAAARERAQLAAYRERIGKPASIRLSPEQLSLNGTIHWPTALLDSRYDEVRTRLDKHFAKWATWTGDRLDAASQVEVDAAIKAMLSTLDDHAQTLSATEWAVARRFVKGLRTEAHTLEGTTALVAGQ